MKKQMKSRLELVLKFVFGAAMISCTQKTYDLNRSLPVNASYEEARELIIQAHKSGLFDSLKIAFPKLADQKGNFVQFSYGQQDSINHPNQGHIDILVTSDHKELDLPAMMNFVEVRMKNRISDFEKQRGR